MTEPDFINDDDLDANDDQNDRGSTGGRNWKALREKADKYDEEVPALRRENAFLKAGIPDTPQGRLLQKAYDGEPTPEAIRQAAVEYGILDTADADVPGDEFDALERVDSAVQGGTHTPPKAPDMNAVLRRAAGRS